ncbi:heterokaryon incompatibility protein-domain-containing protein [Astrocystis sublimbata]|nr:heterokaryon incompatibility protein-domain-containing protein [Astrocystis sublimbata]
MERDAVVTPHQLCRCCQEVAATYMPSPKWQRNEFFEGKSCREIERLRKSYKEVRPYEDIESVPDIILFWRSKQPVVHHKNVSYLKESAKNGCHVCVLLADNFGSLGTQRPSETPGIKRKLYVAPVKRFAQYARGIGTMLGLFDTYPGPVASNYRASNKPIPVSYVELRHHRHRRDRGSNPHEDDGPSVLEVENGNQMPESRFRWSQTTHASVGLEMMSSWLRNCLDNHGKCSVKMGTDRPKRLLDLAAYERDVRLVSEHETCGQPYATLSYRWGNPSSSSITLTHKTLCEFMQMIDVDTLPKTIQEAIQLSRDISLRYLWVDALCIIQGDARDFSDEISRMGAIYANSLVTIAAASSVDSAGGLHVDRQPLSQEDCLMWHDDNSLVYVRGSHSGCDQDLHRHEMSTLDSRVWAYQERVMAPRTLRFTSNEIVWECRELQQCQRCTDSGFREPRARRKRYTQVLNHKETFAQIHTDRSSDTAGKAQLYRLDSTAMERMSTKLQFEILWTRVLLDYSKTNLSYDEDKLSALAGIAASPQQHLGLEASFGMWHIIFIDELLWQPGTKAGRRIALEKVPSWSWIKMEGSVSVIQDPKYHHLMPHRVIEEAAIPELPAATPFGPISEICAQYPSAASFQICGRLASCRLVPHGVKFARVKYSDWSLVRAQEDANSQIGQAAVSAWELYEQSLEGRDCLKQFKSLGIATEDGLAPLRRTRYFPDIEPESQSQSQSRRVFVCLLAKRTLYTDDYRDIGTGACALVDLGLVLEPLDDAATCYRRIGTFREEISCIDMGCARLHEHGNEQRYVHGPEDEREMLELLGPRAVMFSDRERVPRSTIRIV